ncbi:1-phosphofructokinase family hexose kinase [Dietzia sp.]|uniref:1-phosphofructokinase family hexose kinase n=1 Tax=Dietzia sp. TaxID=1871616 RepID=UPI002FDA5759
MIEQRATSEPRTRSGSEPRSVIATLTMNPSVDRTAGLDTELERGGVNRLGGITDVAGGKGINVARVVHDSGSAAAAESIAVFPAAESDPFVAMVREAGIAHEIVPVTAPVRVNLTVTEPDGTTTKLNAPGAELAADVQRALIDCVAGAARGRKRNGTPGTAGTENWAALCGSLPSGTSPDFYLSATETLHDAGLRVALDTSDAPLEALAAALRSRTSGAPAPFAPDLIKPNGLELGQLTGLDGIELERAASAGDPRPAAEAAARLVEAGIASVLVTLGGAGAVLATAEGAWFAEAPRIEVRSTVGAGDSSLAGYLLAAGRGLGPAERLRWAVAHGSAAAALPGTGLPAALDVAAAPAFAVTPL